MKSLLIASLLPVLAIVGLDHHEVRKTSAVVQVELSPLKVDDHHESFSVDVKVAKGWYVYSASQHKSAIREPGMATALKAQVRAFHIDGDAEPVWVRMVSYPVGALRNDRVAGGSVRAYEGTVRFEAWIPKDELRNAKQLAVKVHLVAFNGEKQLEPTVITATYNRRPQ